MAASQAFVLFLIVSAPRHPLAPQGPSIVPALASAVRTHDVPALYGVPLLPPHATRPLPVCSHMDNHR